jgi:hypothetical protein
MSPDDKYVLGHESLLIKSTPRCKLSCNAIQAADLQMEDIADDGLNLPIK